VNPHMLTLRCQTVIDGRLYWALVPVDRMLWEADEYAQEHARRAARKELRYRATKHTGRDLTDVDFDTLPVWVEHPNRCEIECVGGPCDGQRMTWGSPEPPPSVDLPVDEGVAGLLAAAEGEPASALRKATYVPLMGDGGFFSRAKDGAWRYAFSG